MATDDIPTTRNHAWPADRYLNLWVAKLAGGLLGSMVMFTRGQVTRMRACLDAARQAWAPSQTGWQSIGRP
jgi:hypothetical protein